MTLSLPLEQHGSGHQASTSTCQEVFSLPVKRLLDVREMRLREATKLPRELEISDAQTFDEAIDAILKVKLIGVNYKKDFEPFKRRNGTYTDQIVPGFRIIGSIVGTIEKNKSTPIKSKSKHLVFPYSNCINQNSNKPCENCKTLLRENAGRISHDTYELYRSHPCSSGLIYGFTIDGGFQDYIKIASPSKTLVKIPQNVSVHDCCFIYDIILPFYSYLSRFLSKKNNIEQKKILILLNDAEKEINEVLIVLRFMLLDPRSFFIMDPSQINALDESEKALYKSKFDHAFLFNFSDSALSFAAFSSVSTGLEATKDRYTIVLFDEKNRVSFPYKLNDRTIMHTELSYSDILLTEEIIAFISLLNHSMSGSQDQTSLIVNDHILLSFSSLASGSIHSYTSETLFTTSDLKMEHSSPQVNFSREDVKKDSTEERPKVLRFSEDQGKDIRPKTHHYSWIWYEKDFTLIDNSETADDYDTLKLHGIKEVNKRIKYTHLSSKVCYRNRKRKGSKINALLFS